MKIFQVMCMLALSAFLLTCRSKQKVQENSLFELKDSTETGVGFNNQLRPDTQLNIMDYLYFYNGGGVATGDINNDGLADVYFVSNQGKNKLYLNKGKKDNAPFHFEDITEKSGVAGMAQWQTGVTMADVNGDGLLDIYVCAVGKFRELKGKNELYINNGDLTFTEQAAAYGLDFTGFSTQAAFFDYDNDGDLDCYLLNHAVHTSLSYGRVSMRDTRNPESGDYLFENQINNVHSEGGPVKFTDVSEKAGIFGAAMGYGLGVAIADLNNDGLSDIYVSNDFHEDDYCYINNGNGTFSEKGKEMFRYMSRYSMGNDIADVNNDGYPDIMTLDMYPEDEFVEKSSIGEDPLDIYLYKLSFGYMPQLSRNSLQINLSGKRFTEVAAMAGVAATDWSWSPLLADYDNDGVKDLFISNGIAHRPNNLDYTKYIAHESAQDLMAASGTFDAKAMAMMPEGKVHNYLFKGSKELVFQNKSLTWGFEKAGISNGAAYADFDNDGDLDLVTNNLNEPSVFYMNRASEDKASGYLRVKLENYPDNTFALGAKVIIKNRSGMQMQQLATTRGFESASEPILHFGIGEDSTVDSLIVVWPNQKMQVLTGVKKNQLLKIKYDPSPYAVKDPAGLIVKAPDGRLFEDISANFKIPYKHQENQYFDLYRESLMPFLVSTEGPKVSVADVNGDGLEDMYVGGAKWQAGTLFLQSETGKFKQSSQADFLADSTFEDVDAVFFDANGDGHLDLYVVSGGNEFYAKMPEQLDRLYFNDGKGNFKRNKSSLPEMFDNKSCVRPFDIDQDGDVDLFVGGRVVGFQYGVAPSSYVLINDGKGHFSDKTNEIAPTLKNLGMVTDALWADINGDKLKDLVVVGDWMPVQVFINNKGKLSTEKAMKYQSPSGLWQCVSAADFDQDGDIDLVAGNLGQNNKFRKRPDSHLKMWVKDFDNNMGLEQVLSYSVEDKWYPVAFKDELGKKMPSVINKRFTDYKSYAGKTINEIFKPEELKDARLLEVSKFESVYLENKDGGFLVHDLPREVQVSKVFTFAVGDINEDGKPDLLGGGNYFGVSMYQGRYASSYGLILINKGKGNFQSMSPVDTGFLLDGEIRDIKAIKVGNAKVWVVGRNNLPLSIFKPVQKRLVL